MSPSWAVAVIALFILWGVLFLTQLYTLHLVGLIHLEARKKLVKEDGPPIGSRAPALVARQIGSNQTFSVKEQRGKELILFFLTADCAHCFRIATYVAKLMPLYRGDSILAAVINGTDEKQELKFIQDTHLPIPAIAARETAAFGLYGVKGTPQLCVIDTAGVVVNKSTFKSVMPDLFRMLDIRPEAVGYEPESWEPPPPAEPAPAPAPVSAQA